MNSHDLVGPLLMMLGITVLVWFYMYVVRIGYMMKNRISASAVPTPQRVREVLPEHINNPANNLLNLFEVPVLFYALVLLLIWAGPADALTVKLAWAYVGLRLLHSIVQCTFNHVLTRFVIYSLSCFALIAMLLRTTLQYWGVS